MLKYALCASEGAPMYEPVLFRGSYDRAFAYAKEMGYSGVEIHLRDARKISAGMLEQASEESSVQVAAIATGLVKRVDGLSLVDDDRMRRREAVERVKGHLDLAAHFGCPVIIGSMRANIPEPARREETLQRLRESLLELADYICDKNCTLVLEAINRYENNYLNTAEETAAFLDRVGAPKILMLLDTFHMNIEERRMAEVFRDYRQYIGHVHFGDNTRWYPGHGQIGFRSVIRQLEEIRYAGWVSMEYLPLPNEREAARAGAMFIREIQGVNHV